jgi:glycosyltransferase involved in cell wall biosynthesis
MAGNTEKSLISIITPCLNRTIFVERAIQSALRQDYSNMEHIVMDGGSTDGTLSVLAHYHHLTVVSGSDRGVYDALNKGIQLSRGEIIGQLNTDDYYEENIFKEIIELFAQNPKIDAFVGGSRVIEKDATGIYQILAQIDPVQPGELVYRATIGVPIFNAWFFRRSLFEKIGFYSVSYQIASDRDFLLRLALTDIQFAPVNKIFYTYLQHPGSLSMTTNYSQREKYMLESFRISESWMKSIISPRPIIMACKKWYLYLCRNLLALGVITHKPGVILLSIFRFGKLIITWPFIIFKLQTRSDEIGN